LFAVDLVRPFGLQLSFESSANRKDAPMSESRWVWRAVAALLILSAAGLHLLFLARNCPFDLAPDEAHYWQWSRDLDASYYSKGPLVAYLIRASCELTGSWSVAISGHEGLAVRLPAVICGSLMIAGLYVLAVQCFGDERLGTIVAAIALSLPTLTVGHTIMTIDAPYMCCWAWALVFGHRAIFRHSAWAWPLLGLMIGLGILAKYTMVLWIPCAGLFLVYSRDHRWLLRRPGFWTACAIAAAFCLPILWWNFNNGWVTFRHVGGQAGVAVAENKPFLLWAGPIRYLSGQIGVLFGVWFVVWLLAMWQCRPGRESEPNRLFLWFLSAPQFVFFGLFSLKTEVMLNWPATGYLSGLILAMGWYLDWLRGIRASARRWLIAGATMTIAAGILLAVLVHEAAAFRPFLAQAAGPPRFAGDIPVRRFDPTCRMRGWRHLGAQFDRIRQQMPGQTPVLAAARWTIASELAFYCDGHPMVYSLGSALRDRQSQFDLWRPNPIRDQEEFLGRTFVFVDVGGISPEIQAAFERTEATRRICYDEDDTPIAFWDVTICHCFRGFPNLPRQRY
jgi:Dolichyl-phosphate-mannose-protein mannosyltransferase